MWQPIAVSIPASAARRRAMYQTSVRDIAPCPTLHRSGRAGFPHPAPASGSDAKAVQRIRMIDVQRGQPAVNEPPHSVPLHPAILAALRQRPMPEPAHLRKPGSLPCPAAEIARYHVQLRRSRPSRARAHDLDLIERAREARLHLVESFAHEELRDHRTTRPQLRTREFERRHLQFECERLIALPDAAQLRREIARYEI